VSDTDETLWDSDALNPKLEFRASDFIDYLIFPFSTDGSESPTKATTHPQTRTNHGWEKSNSSLTGFLIFAILLQI